MSRIRQPRFVSASTINYPISENPITGDYTIDPLDHTVVGEPTVIDLNFTLPDATLNSGMEFHIANLGSSGFAVVVNTVLSQQIFNEDGKVYIRITDGDTHIFKSFNGGWFVK